MLTEYDCAVGNTISGPNGSLRIAAELPTNQGTFLIVEGEHGLSGLVHRESVIENQDYALDARLAPSGAPQVQDEAASAALKSEVERLSALTNALLKERAEGTPEPAPETTSPQTGDTPPAGVTS